jgi:hypothetical protein
MDDASHAVVPFIQTQQKPSAGAEGFFVAHESVVLHSLHSGAKRDVGD